MYTSPLPLLMIPCLSLCIRTWMCFEKYSQAWNAAKNAEKQMPRYPIENTMILLDYLQGILASMVTQQVSPAGKTLSECLNPKGLWQCRNTFSGQQLESEGICFHCLPLVDSDTFFSWHLLNGAQIFLIKKWWLLPSISQASAGEGDPSCTELEEKCRSHLDNLRQTSLLLAHKLKVW